MTRCVALLRGINLGARNRVAMPRLIAVFESLGHGDVSTYIQSGNVCFSAAPRMVTAHTAVALESALRDELGCDVPVVVRTASEMAAIVRGNPFVGRVTDESKLAVVFLGDARSAGAATLDPQACAPEEFELKGNEVFVHSPRGFAGSKVSPYLERQLASRRVTMRSWKTTHRLVELLRE